MKKFILSGSVITVFLLYALHLNTDNEGANVPIQTIPTPDTSTNYQSSLATPVPVASAGSGTGGNGNTGSMMNGGNMGSGMMGKYKNGTYTGSTVDAFYGYVQVQVTVSGGQIADVQFLQYPNDRSTSVYINSQAMPLLKQEAIQAQSANVSGVSGASATSAAFIQSLQSALSQAT